MLIAAKLPHNLEVLLARTTPEEASVSPAVMAALAKKYGVWQKLLNMLLDFNSSAVIPPKLCLFAIVLRGLD